MNAPITDAMSLAALRYAASLTQPDSHELAQRLYLYNRYPLSPGLRRSFPHAGAVLSYLLGGRTSSLDLLIPGGWTQIPSRDGFWTCLGRTGEIARASGLTYKLYVSATLDAAPQAFLATLRALPRSRAAGLKVARQAETLVRPDRLVLYFDTLDDMLATAHDVEGPLAGMPSQGIPFACRFADAAGILSWGIDLPPRSNREPLSWREWITGELGGALSRSKSGILDERVEAALDHVQRKGVDPATWRPDLAAWLPQLDGADG